MKTVNATPVVASATCERWGRTTGVTCRRREAFVGAFVGALTPWTCAKCTYRHADAEADFLQCAMCGGTEKSAGPGEA